MTSARKPYLLLAALVAAISLPVAAQDPGSHSLSSSAGGSGHALPGSSWSHGGSFTGATGRSSVGATTNSSNPNNPPGHPRLPNGLGNRYGYGYGYGYPYGTPYLLPYDSEYDQLEGRGTFEQGHPQEPPDNRVGPTIFEHNGRVSTAVANGRSAVRQASRAEQPSEPESAAAPTVLVFRDGHQQEIANYAIAGNKLIVLGEQNSQKIQLSDLDLRATAKANENRGVDFKMPHPG